MVTVHRAARVELSSPGVTTYADGEPVAPLPAVAECVPGALTDRRHRPRLTDRRRAAAPARDTVEERQADRSRRLTWGHVQPR